MGSSKSSTSNPSSAFSSRISHHGSSSNASLGRPSSDASIPNPTRQSKFSLSPNSNNVSAQQQMSTPPNFHSNNVFVNKPQRPPIRFPLPSGNVFAQKSTTVPSSYPIISTGHQRSGFFPSNPSVSQNFNLFAQQLMTALALGFDFIILNGQKLSARWLLFHVYAQQPTPTLGSYPIISTGQQLSEPQRTLHVDEEQIHLHNKISPFVPERSWRHRQFSSRLSEVKPEKGSWPSNDAFQTNMDDKDINIVQHWVDRMGEKNKGRLCEIGQLDAQYTAEGSLKHQPFTSNSAYQSYDELRQQLHAREQDYDDLKQQFENLENFVKRFLPPDAQPMVHQLQSTPPASQPPPQQ
ncbi:hypothetical protein LR48_Vigan11g116200 [Vigna angularis]|uniref:Uncharacterized protein n=2 Tax=Phaseolus angularis TaxID=3914 RepID=A0A0L9VT56_PHAAN|nr:uncharacterized protein LOC108347676 [Vigna angularis]KAG2380730.1 uncharacterized protein HKW66_Vig0201020 [Vigna angularis]KOM58128.1 hypothetical protein LR48_Vigan11g116200 [Vigna angularis]BAT97374.1 hypothetical protein VIGAN_09080000 [Vigna angularis var. angularis]